MCCRPLHYSSFPSPRLLWLPLETLNKLEDSLSRFVAPRTSRKNLPAIKTNQLVSFYLLFSSIDPLLLEDTYARQPGQSEGADNTQPAGEHDLRPEAGPAPEPVDENSPLLEAGPAPEPESKVGLLEFVTKPEYRLGFMIVAGVMLAQQLTGKWMRTRVWRLVMRQIWVCVAGGHLCTAQESAEQRHLRNML